MDLLDDIFVEPSSVKAPARTKFQPKAKPRLKKDAKEQPIPSAVANSDSSQVIQRHRLNKNLDLPNTSFTVTAGSEQSSLRRCNLENVNADGILLDEAIVAVGSDVTENSEISVSKAIEDGYMAAGVSLGSQGPKDIISQLTTADAFSTQAEGDTSSIPNVALLSTSPFTGCSAPDLFIPSTNQESELSKEIHFGNGGDLQIDMEQETVEFSFLEAVDVTSEAAVTSGNRAVRFQPKPRAQRSNKTNSAQVSHVFDVGEVPSENQHLKGNSLIHVGDVDDVNYGFQFDSSSPAKALSEPASNSNENNDDNHLEEATSKNRRPQDSKKVSSENDNPCKKRTMEVEAHEEPTEKPRKKFPRATRRKQSVDKSLLEAPEGETNLRTVPIRDVTMLADYRQRQAKKQAAAVQPSSTNERSENNTWQEDPPYDEDETYGSDQDAGSFDDPSTSRVIKDTGYFNYKSFSYNRNKRWSKHETELFYQGVQEFGPDFTMIQQQHFPERSRHQVKLKYKNEERRRPMKIHDALTNRAKDLSHFEVLIQKLQDQDKANSVEDDDGGDEETHETHATSQETANSEENRRSAAVDNTVGIESPAKSYDKEDEFDWDEYKSEL